MYQLTAECAYVTQDTASGRARVLLLKGAPIPDNVPELTHLKSMGMVERVGGEPAPAEESKTRREGGQPDGSGEGQSDADGELAKRLAAARAELPEDGSAPKGNAKTDVIAAWLANEGYDFAELVKQERSELTALLKQASS